MVELVWAESAVKDLEGICNYIAQDSEEYANIFASRVIDTIETIGIFPSSGRVVPELNNDMIREMVLTNYRIIYRINNEKVEIVRIIHNARQLKKLE
ncbi:type II toxin-antitoxin system RelE/ParE family toxin [Evansella cellulosilytica]|uniref:Plasmid stabilization system n=1 Tax=Evansella cellulosilytica (strain ATCC 21833 / DSM 2522 / FERM P-1141 / JCM 9156 / N-4) TaxID=649639 RepID=E6TVP3_EVAC2|nr:type II toxin-antitoxin system RelE/ParE family toxin [Evansella cellulosilytica]ADU32171.1 plasmid stabilization system [Evansella cellulosilytica DSM 2522]